MRGAQSPLLARSPDFCLTVAGGDTRSIFLWYLVYQGGY